MTKLWWLLLLMCVVGLEGRRWSRGGGKFRAVGAAGKLMGNAVVNIVRQFREEGRPIPKGYRRQYERPIKEEHTVLYKVTNGLKNFIYLAYGLAACLIIAIIRNIYRACHSEYERAQLAALDPDSQRLIVERLMLNKKQDIDQQLDDYKKYEARRKLNEVNWREVDRQQLKREKRIKEAKQTGKPSTGYGIY